MEMILEKQQIQVLFLFTFKMGHEMVYTTVNISNAFGPGTAYEHTMQWWLKKFYSGD